MIPFPFNENRFLFVANHLLLGQLCTNPKSDRRLLSCLKVTQCLTSEIGDAPLYNLCSLPIQVMTTGPLPAASKCKSGRFNAWGYSSTHWMTLWRWWSRRTPPGRPSTKEFIEKVLAIIDETLQQPIQQIARDLGVSHTTMDACVKEDLKCRSYRRQTSQILTEKTKNLRLIKSVRPPPPPTWTRWTTSFGHTSRTSPTWPPTIPKPAWSPPSAEYLPSSRRRLWKKHAPSSGSVVRRWLRLKVAILNRCQLYYIIKLPESIFFSKVLK